MARVGAVRQAAEVLGIDVHERPLEDARDRVARLERLHLRRDPIRVVPLVVVPLRAQVAARQLERDVAQAAEAQRRVDGAAHVAHLHAGTQRRQHGLVVLVAIVDDHQLEVRPGLRREAPQRARREARALARHHHAAHQRRGHATPPATRAPIAEPTW